MDELEPALASYRNFVTTHPSHDLAELAHLRNATVLFKLERYRAAAEAYELEQKAKAYKARRTGISEAEAKRFAMVRKAYNVSPNVFALRKYMSTLEDSTENIRLYVIPSNSKVGSNKILNLEDQLQFGATDINFSTKEKGDQP